MTSKQVKKCKHNDYPEIGIQFNTRLHGPYCDFAVNGGDCPHLEPAEAKKHCSSYEEL